MWYAKKQTNSHTALASNCYYDFFFFYFARNIESERICKFRFSTKAKKKKTWIKINAICNWNSFYGRFKLGILSTIWSRSDVLGISHEVRNWVPSEEANGSRNLTSFTLMDASWKLISYFPRRTRFVWEMWIAWMRTLGTETQANLWAIKNSMFESFDWKQASKKVSSMSYVTR